MVVWRPLRKVEGKKEIDNWLLKETDLNGYK